MVCLRQSPPIFSGASSHRAKRTSMPRWVLADVTVADLTELEVAFGDEVEFEVLLLD